MGQGVGFLPDMNSSLLIGFQARSAAVMPRDSRGRGALPPERRLPVSAARVRVNGQEHPVLTVGERTGIERRWMPAESAPETAVVVGGERCGLKWPQQAYRVMSWEDRGMVYEGAGFAQWVLVKFEPLGRIYRVR